MYVKKPHNASGIKIKNSRNEEYYVTTLQMLVVVENFRLNVQDSMEHNGAHLSDIFGK